MNANDPKQLTNSDGIDRVTFGTPQSNFDVKLLDSTHHLLVEFKGIQIQSNLVGAYNLPNILAAACIGKYFKIERKKIKEAIGNYAPSNSRSQLIQKESNTIILDAYNANPGSMKMAIENFAGIKGDKKILLLGSMMELGAESKKEHAAIISLIEKYKWYAVVLVGKEFNETENPYTNYENSLQARDWLKHEHLLNAQILIKGSRSMQMEKVLE